MNIEELNEGDKFKVVTTDEMNRTIKVGGVVIKQREHQTVVKLDDGSLVGLKYLQHGTEIFK
ncbi:MAG: hypothetical protein PF440_01455 [Thiomicrorhabdus sp.]|jgi:hypothetical protein|nr:hypothetical protein [Thiomicrorhabdus sp.]